MTDRYTMKVSSIVAQNHQNAYWQKNRPNELSVKKNLTLRKQSVNFTCNLKKHLKTQ